MKKLISVLSVLAVILAGIGLLGLLIAIGGQNVWKPLYIGHDDYVHFIIPWGTLLYGIALLITACLLLGGKNSRSIGTEITATILLFVMPRLNDLISYLQSVSLARYGNAFLSTYSIVNDLCSIPSQINSIAFFAALFVCGLRIAHKKTQLQ